MKALTSALIGRSVSCDHMASRGWDQLFQNKVDSVREEGRVSQKEKKCPFVKRMRGSVTTILHQYFCGPSQLQS